MSIPEHYENHPTWGSHPWDYEAMGHRKDGIRPCSCCHKPIDTGWITEDGNGPWCSPACMGWDDKEVMDEDISNMPTDNEDGSLFWTDFVDDPSDDPAYRAELREEYEVEWIGLDPGLTLDQNSEFSGSAGVVIDGEVVRRMGNEELVFYQGPNLEDGGFHSEDTSKPIWEHRMDEALAWFTDDTNIEDLVNEARDLFISCVPVYLEDDDLHDYVTENLSKELPEETLKDVLRRGQDKAWDWACEGIQERVPSEEAEKAEEALESFLSGMADGYTPEDFFEAEKHVQYDDEGNPVFPDDVDYSHLVSAEAYQSWKVVKKYIEDLKRVAGVNA